MDYALARVELINEEEVKEVVLNQACVSVYKNLSMRSYFFNI